MPRPETPKLAVGDALFMHSGTPGRRDGKRYSDVRVTTVGRKYVHVIGSDDYERFVAEPESWRWKVRKFLIEDMREGERGRRIGYTASLATVEQRAYDEQQLAASIYLRDVVGLDVRRDSPLHRNPDALRAVAALLKLHQAEWLPPAEAPK